MPALIEREVHMVQSLGSLVRFQLGRDGVAIYSPDIAVFEMVKQFLILRIAHVAGPHYLGAIDLRIVPNPLPIDVVALPVVDEN